MNCAPCQGTGLLNSQTVCATCKGLGNNGAPSVPVAEVANESFVKRAEVVPVTEKSIRKTVTKGIVKIKAKAVKKIIKKKK